MVLDIYSQTKYIHIIIKMHFFKQVEYIKVNLDKPYVVTYFHNRA